MPTVTIKRQYRYNKYFGWILIVLGILGVGGGGLLLVELLFFNIMGYGLYVIMILGGLLALIGGVMNILKHGKKFTYEETVDLPEESKTYANNGYASNARRRQAAAYYWHKRFGRR